MKKILVLFLTILSFQFNAQEIIPITKSDALAKVKQNNYALMIAQKDLEAAQAGLDQTKASYLPNVKLSYTGVGTDNPLMAFGSKLNQQRVEQTDFIPDALNNPDLISDFSTKLEVQQPMLNFDAKHYKKAAISKIQATEWQIKRTSQYLELELEKAYIQLQMAYRAEELIEKAKGMALDNKRIAENNFKQGFLQQSDVLAVDVRISEIDIQLQQAKTNIADASNYIMVLMNEESNAVLQPIDSLFLLSSEQIMQQKVSNSRADFQAMRAASEAHEHMHKANEKTFLPRINAFGSYELHDETPLTDEGGFLVGIQASWDIFQGGRRYGKAKELTANWEKSKLQEKQYVSQAQMELNMAFRKLKDAAYQVELTRLAVEQSKEVLRIRTNRFEQGLERTTDVLIAETQYAQKQMDLYMKIAAHNLALAQLRFLEK